MERRIEGSHWALDCLELKPIGPTVLDDAKPRMFASLDAITVTIINTRLNSP